MMDKNTGNPMEHSASVIKESRTLTDHPRQHVMRVEEPGDRALFEMSAEVAQGLEKSFTDCKQKNEAAWQN